MYCRLCINCSPVPHAATTFVLVFQHLHEFIVTWRICRTMYCRLCMLIVTEPVIECVCWGVLTPHPFPLAGSLTVYAKTTVHSSPDSSMFLKDELMKGALALQCMCRVGMLGNQFNKRLKVFCSMQFTVPSTMDLRENHSLVLKI